MITKEETKKARTIANEIAKKYGYKVSITKNGGALTIAVIAGKKLEIIYSNSLNIAKRFAIKIFEEFGGDLDLNEFKSKLDEILEEYEHINDFYNYYSNLKSLKNGYLQHIPDYTNLDLQKMVKEIEEAVKRELDWYDDSDSMTDYFDTKFYLNFQIGKWDKKYKELLQ